VKGSSNPTLAEAIVASPARDSAIQRLREPGALAVTTGQQPGLFTGPLYTIYKALSTAALARILERQWQRPVVPVFWVAGDDHDYSEASQVSWVSSEGAVRTASLPPRLPDAPLTPLYREPLGPAINDILNALETDLPPSEFRDWTTTWLRRHYQPAKTVAGSFAGALAELLAPRGGSLSGEHSRGRQAAGRAISGPGPGPGTAAGQGPGAAGGGSSGGW